MQIHQGHLLGRPAPHLAHVEVEHGGYRFEVLGDVAGGLGQGGAGQAGLLHPGCLHQAADQSLQHRQEGLLLGVAQRLGRTPGATRGSRHPS